MLDLGCSPSYTLPRSLGWKTLRSWNLKLLWLHDAGSAKFVTIMLVHRINRHFVMLFCTLLFGPESWPPCPCRILPWEPDVLFGMSSLEMKVKQSQSFKVYWTTIIASSYKAILWDKWHSQEGQELCFQSWELHTFWGTNNRYGALMSDLGQVAPTRREADPIHPATSTTATKLTSADQKASCCPRAYRLAFHPLL